MEGLIPPLAPAIVLSVLVGTFQTCLYVVVRGAIGKHLPLTLLAAIAGALAGHLVGRLTGDPVQIGDFNVLWASLMAWVGIIVVAGIAAIRPARVPRAEPHASHPSSADTSTNTRPGAGVGS